MDQLAKATDRAHQIFDSDAAKLMIAKKLDQKLLKYAAELLDDEKQLPRGLGRYVAQALRLYIHKLTGTPARAEETNLWRDLLIQAAVREMKQFGFHPTRNRQQKRKKHSGCSIVAEVANTKGLNLSEHAVENIWQGRSKAQKNRHRQALVNALLAPSQKPATANYPAGLFSQHP